MWEAITKIQIKISCCISCFSFLFIFQHYIQDNRWNVQILEVNCQTDYSVCLCLLSKRIKSFTCGQLKCDVMGAVTLVWQRLKTLRTFCDATVATYTKYYITRWMHLKHYTSSEILLKILYYRLHSFCEAMEIIPKEGWARSCWYGNKTLRTFCEAAHTKYYITRWMHLKHYTSSEILLKIFYYRLHSFCEAMEIM